MRGQNGGSPRWLLLVAFTSLVACTANDGASLPASAGSSGASGAGSGAGGSGSGAGGAGGGSSSGGSTTDLDAGLDGAVSESRDATPDAAPGNACVVGTIEEYCSLFDCPALADASQSLQGTYPLVAEEIVLRPCTTPGGAARISVSANYLSMSKTFIYDAQTEQLVGFEIRDDVGFCPGATAVGDTRFGQVAGYYGEADPDCGSHFPEFLIPEACGSIDAGVHDAGVDAGPYECDLTHQ